jgi:hypothetical protein
MCIRKRFNSIFGLRDTIEQERKRFVNRINLVIFHEIESREAGNVQKYGSATNEYSQLFNAICFELGVEVDNIPRNFGMYGGYGGHFITPIRTLTKDVFEQTLLVLCILYKCLKDLPVSKQEWLSQQIQESLSRCTCEIGISWKEGIFYPVGAEELDRPLIEETLTWLNNYPDEKKDYQKALEYYMRNGSLPDVINSCYSALEGISRKLLGNNKTLDNNKDELLRKISLSNGWKPIIAQYVTYAHDFRHASDKRHQITKQETEAYLYMTGLIIRLLIESKQMG